MINYILILLAAFILKAIISLLPCLIKIVIKKLIPYKQYSAEEVIACKYMKPDLYYKKHLMQSTYNFKYKDIVAAEIDVDTIREEFKRKMQNRELTRNQILYIRNYLEKLIDCNEKKFDNDCHCIYYCLKRLDNNQTKDLTVLANLLR